MQHNQHTPSGKTPILYARVTRACLGRTVSVCCLQVSILVEGQALPLTELSELISRTLSSGSSSGQCNKGATTPAPADPAGLSTTTQDAAAAAAAAVGEATTAAGVAAGGSAAAAGEGGAGGPSALVVRHLIQEVASRKSYGLQDGETPELVQLKAAQQQELPCHGISNGLCSVTA
jgi:hypothetical protein